MFITVKRAGIAAAFAAAAIVPAAPAAAAPGVPCFEGYVCVALEKGTIIAVPEGQSQTFPSGTVMTGIVNRTRISYCVGGSMSFGLDPGREVINTQTISGFAPGRICLS